MYTAKIKKERIKRDYFQDGFKGKQDEQAIYIKSLQSQGQGHIKKKGLPL